MGIQADLIISNVGELVTLAGSPRLRKGAESGSLSIIQDATVICSRGRITWVGANSDFPVNIDISSDAYELNADGRTVTPGFVDSHTHPLFAGTRQVEFALRAQGADYEAIAAAGGGILNSVQRTRNATSRELENNFAEHMGTMLLLGTTTVEVKSGYGLDLDTEIKCLQAAGDASEYLPQTIIRTFLGAHEVPLEFRGEADGYIDYLINIVLPVVSEKKLADFVDIFCEKGVFSPKQSIRYLRAAERMGFGLRIHADEFHDTGGARVAVDVGASSADHLLSISNENMKLIARSETAATLLPGTALFLGKPFPPGRELIDAGAGVALATDFNPGSCYCESMPFMVNLAVCQCGMTIEEAMVAATINGAASLNLAHRKGGIYPGMDADMIIWDLDDYRGIAYHMAVPDIEEVVVDGQLLSTIF